MRQVLVNHRSAAFTSLALALPLLASGSLHAQTAATAVAPALAKFNGADTAWMLISTVLVLLMTVPGIMRKVPPENPRRKALARMLLP